MSQIYFGMKLHMFRTVRLSETCGFSWQNKFVKLVHLVGLLIKKTATSVRRANRASVHKRLTKSLDPIFSDCNGDFMQGTCGLNASRSRYNNQATVWTTEESWFDSPQEETGFCLLQSDEIGSGSHTASYLVDAGDFSRRG